jgi:hypothetical protein
VRRAVLLALALLVPLLGAPPADAAQVEGRLRLASQTPWVEADAPFELRVVATASPDLTLGVVVHRPVTSRSQFARTLEGDSLGGRLLPAVPVALAGLDRDPAGAYRVQVPTDRLPDGVLPVVIELRDGQSVVDRLVTHLLHVGNTGEAPPLAVAWVQHLGTGPALQADGNVDIDDSELADLADVATTLAASDVPLSLAPTPETLDALAVDGGDTVLADLVSAATDRQVLAGTYVDVDVEGVLAAGIPEELAAQRTRGSDVLTAAVGRRIDPRAWSASRPLGPDGIGALRGLGVDRLVVPEAGLAPLNLDLTLTRPFLLDDGRGGAIDAAAADPDLAAHADERDDPVLAAHHLLADLAVLWGDQPGRQRGVVVQPATGRLPRNEFLATALAGIASSPILEGVTLDGLFERVPPTSGANDEPLVRTLVDEGLPAPTDLRPEARALADLRRDIRGYVGMVGDGAPDLDLLARLALVGLSDDLDRAGRLARLDGGRALIEARIRLVGIVDQGGFRLTAREGTIPLTLVNGMGHPVRVAVTLRSDRLDFPDDEPGPDTERRIDVVLDRENTSVPVEVRARTTGAFPVDITLTSPDGSLVVAQSRLTVRSTGASGVGVILSTAAAAFLAIWWASHWRTTRRAKRLIPTA